MDLEAFVRAVEVLISPLEWGSRDAWLAESVKRVREERGQVYGSAGVSEVSELEQLLRLEGDEPGWLEAALDSSGGTSTAGGMPAVGAGGDECLRVLSLRSALTAGLAMLERQRQWRRTLGEVCDGLNAGMAIFRRDGVGEIARNARWEELLDEEPERDLLRDLIKRQTGYAAASVGPLAEHYGEVELSRRSYQVIAKLAPAGSLLPDAGVLVLMDRTGPELPTTRELRISFGLRGREPQIALLAAEGLSNAAIAQQLRLSAHTVRHYLERVLTRLGLHSRNALALHLMAGEREKPPVAIGDKSS